MDGDIKCPVIVRVFLMAKLNVDITKRLVAAGVMLIAYPERIFVEMNSLRVRAAEDREPQPAVAHRVDMVRPMTVNISETLGYALGDNNRLVRPKKMFVRSGARHGLSAQQHCYGQRQRRGWEPILERCSDRTHARLLPCTSPVHSWRYVFFVSFLAAGVGSAAPGPDSEIPPHPNAGG